MTPTDSDVIRRITQSARTTINQGLYQLEFQAMSTLCQIKCHGAPGPAIREFQQAAVAWVAQFEARYSRFLPDSLIGRINAAAGQSWVETDPDTDRLFNLCQELFFFTSGSFDPTALPLIELWNWKQRPPVLPADDVIQARRELVGWTKIQRRPGGIFLPRPGMGLDLGGIGKEYAVDCVMELAIQRGLPNVLVDFGQDVRARGHSPGHKFWRIGLEDARSPGKTWAGVGVTDAAVATSGDYLRHFEINGRRFGHILDPRTGYPAINDCRAASIIGPTCTFAGLLATTVCILGAKAGLSLVELHPATAGAVTTPDHRHYSRRFYEYQAA